METRKSRNANLEDKRMLYFQIGITVATALALVAFEWTSLQTTTLCIDNDQSEGIIEQMVINTQREVPKPPPPRPVEVIQIVENTVEIKEISFEGLDVSLDTEIPVYSWIEETPEEDPVILIPEVWPSFQGGNLNQFRMYVARNLIYPKLSAENGVTGRVHLQFVVNKKGEVEDVVVLRGVNPDIDAEAIRVVRESPQWTPGRQGGMPVRVQYSFSIVFMLQ